MIDGGSRTEGTRIGVGQEDETRLVRIGEYLCKGGGIFDGLPVCIELAITIVDRYLVPRTDTDGIGMGEVRHTVLIERDPRMRVVHDADGVLVVVLRVGTRCEVVRKAKSVSRLMRTELA